MPPWDCETLPRERSCRSLTDWRSGLQVPVALHPVAGWGLSWCESREQVSYWPSRGKPMGLSSTPGTVIALTIRHPRPRHQETRSPGARRSHDLGPTHISVSPLRGSCLSLLRGKGRPVSREAHVRFWEGVGVKLPRATHFLILSEPHLRRLLRAYVVYYNTTRPHQSLDNNSPLPRVIEPPPMWPDHRHSSDRRAPSPLPARRLIAVGRRLGLRSLASQMADR